MKVCYCESSDTTAIGIFTLCGISSQTLSHLQFKLHFLFFFFCIVPRSNIADSNPHPHNNSVHRPVHNIVNPMTGCMSLVTLASGKAPSRYAVPRIPKTSSTPCLHHLPGPSEGSTKVTGHNLHLTADISRAFLTFLARCVPCVEFPSCDLKAAALTL